MNNFITSTVFLILLTLTTNSYAKDVTSLINSIESKSHFFNGFAFAVIKNEKVIHKSVHGYCKTGNDELITSKSLFPIASISKSITALAVARLVDEGKLSFDEKVFLPYLKDPTTLREILNQTTGYKFTGNRELDNGLNRNQLLEKLKQQNPICNHCYFYSNTVLSLVDEILKQKGLSIQYAVDNLNRSLNTNDIQLAPVDKKFAIVSRHKNNKPLGYSNYQLTVPASAGVYTSLDGMIEVLKVISGTRKDIISEKTLKQLFTSYSQNDDIFKWSIDISKEIKSYYGLGWRVLKNKNDKTFIFHSGHISGMFAFIGFIPSENIGIIFMHSGKIAKERSVIFEELIKF